MIKKCFFSINLFLICFCIFAGFVIASSEDKSEKKERIKENNINLIYNENYEIMGSQDLNAESGESQVTISGDWLLKKNIIIEGDMNISGGSVDLNGFQLTIKGDLNLKRGNLSINGGKLVVKGDFNQQTIDRINGETVSSYNNSYFRMTNEKDYVLVEGNYLNHSINSHQGLLIAGLMEIKGDFRQLNKSIGNFNATQTHTVLLSGEKKQIVSFENIDYCKFNKLIITNSSNEGILFDTKVYVEGEYKNKQTHLENGNNLTLSIYAIPKSPDYKGNVEIISNSVIEDNTNIRGDLNVRNYLDLNGKTLTVDGNMFLSEGILNINGGKLIVKGDLIQQKNYITLDGMVKSFESHSEIRMCNEKDYILVNGDYLIESRENGILTNGIIEIKGDFKQLRNSNKYSFLSSGDHKVILSGEREQNISFEYWDCSSFNILEVKNSSTEGIKFETKIGVNKEYINDNTPVENEENLILSVNSMSDYPQYSGDVFVWNDNVLKQNLNIKGDLYINGDLNLNGNNLEVAGEVFLSKGTLDINGGKLIVNKNFKQQTKYIAEDGMEKFSPSISILNMTHDEDYILIKGDFITNNQSDKNNLTAGVIEIKGNFKQMENEDNFQCKGQHRVVLSGDKRQNINFEHWNCSYFNILEIINTSKEGVNFETKVMVTNDYIVNKTFIENKKNLIINLDVLCKKPDLDAEVCVIKPTLIDKDVIVKGNLNIQNDLDLNGKTLMVEGNIYFNKGILDINNGTLIVKGDFLQMTKFIHDDGTEILLTNYSVLKMNDKKDYILVYGSYINRSIGNHSGCLSSGVLEVKGDFTFVEHMNRIFWFENEHKIILSGDKIQNVNKEYCWEVYFNILEIKNTSKEGVNFKSNVTVCKEYINSKTPVQNTKNLYLSIDAVYNDSQNYEDIKMMNWTTLENDITIEGNLTVFSELCLNGKTLTVKGDLYLSNGYIDIDGGKLIVEGDFRKQCRSIVEGKIEFWYSEAKLIMKNKEDYILIKGNFISGSSSWDDMQLTAGTIEVKGDLQVSSYNINFICKNEHKVVLSGDKKQNISLVSTNNSCFNILEIKNTSPEGVCLETKINIDKEYLNLKTPVINIYNLKLSLNALYYNNEVPNEFYIWKSTVLEKDVILNGSLNIDENLDLNGKTLIVEGDVYLGSGILNINKGKLIVKGDFRHQYKQTSENGKVEFLTSSAFLNMIYDEDYVLVNGNVIINNGYSHYGKLKAGTFEIKGDYKHTGNFFEPFYFTHKHKVIFSGNKKQRISVENLMGNVFNILEISNTSKEGIVFESRVGVDCQYKNEKTPVVNKENLTLYVGGECICSEGNKELFLQEHVLKEDTNIKGNLYLFGSLDLNGKVLTIDGNLLLSYGTLNINGGKLIVTGDFRQQSEEFVDGKVNYKASNSSLKMINEVDYVLVYGSYINDTKSSGYLQAGIIEIKGDVKQIGDNFVCEDKHKVILSGNKKQSVNLKNRWSSCFNILEFKNSAGISIETKVPVKKEIRSINSTVENKDNLLLSIDSYMNLSQWNYWINRNYILENDYSIVGGLYLEGDLDLNGKTLIVDGNIDINFGAINFNGGTLIVKDCLKQNSGKINIGPEGVFKVEGDVIQKNGNTVIGEGGIYIAEGDLIMENGSIDIADGKYTVGGQILNSTGNLIINNDRIYVEGISTITKGDFNKDGTINSLDAAIIKRYILGLQLPQGIDMGTGDINEDGQIDSLDYVLIRKHVLEISFI